LYITVGIEQNYCADDTIMVSYTERPKTLVQGFTVGRLKNSFKEFLINLIIAEETALSQTLPSSLHFNTY